MKKKRKLDAITICPHPAPPAFNPLVLKRVAMIVALAFGCIFFTSGPVSLADGYDYYFSVAADLLNKGMFLEALGMYEAANGSAENANNRAQALLLMGTIHSLYLDQYDTALEKFNMVLQAYPDSPAASEALFNIGMVYYETDDFKRAYGIFNNYIAKYPGGRQRQSAEVWAENSKIQMDTTNTGIQPLARKRIVDTTIRVLLKENVPTVVVDSEQTLSVIDIFSGKAVFQGHGRLRFSQQDRELAVNGRRLKRHMCRVTSAGTAIKLDDRRYRGALMISTSSEGMDVVNYLSVEAYLYGVLPEEMSDSWDPQALMAQSVAARTYALYLKRKSTDKPYDLQNTTASQAYGGFDAEQATTNTAVDATRGQVMTQRGKLIIAYYHANSGGHTEDARNVWKTDIPYLKGVPDGYSKNVPGNDWTYFISYDDLKEHLNQWGLNINRIYELKTAGCSPSGRILEVAVISDKGTHVFTGNNFRINLDGTRLKSTLFRVTPAKDGVLLIGSGYGHGVGMSQWGALRMAQAGYTYQDILKFYYHNITIRTFAGG